MPPRFAPTRLVDYPWVVVRIACSLCGRAGKYRLARLAACYGPEQRLDGLLRDLCHTCPWYNERARKGEPRCGACFIDLERNLPSPDDPDEPLIRQRQPAREDVLKLRRIDRFPAASPGVGPMLSGWHGDRVGYHCRRCPRREVFTKTELLARHGDRRLTDLLLLIAADCPRQGNTQVYELCGAMLILPGRDELERDT